MDESWFRRRFFEFRHGHGVYLIFFLSFANFVLIFYRLLIEQIPILTNIFTNLWIFVLTFVLLYPPIAILIGHWHTKTQLSTENTIITEQNPLLMNLIENVDTLNKKIDEVQDQLKKEKK